MWGGDDEVVVVEKKLLLEEDAPPPSPPPAPPAPPPPPVCSSFVRASMVPFFFLNTEGRAYISIRSILQYSKSLNSA